MKLKKREPITKKQAERRTATHKRDFAGLKKGWVRLGQDVDKSVRLGVPAALGMNMRDWLEKTFPESASHIFRQLQSYRALQGVSPAKLERMPEANAHELTRLPEKDRKAPQIVAKAVSQTPKEFKETISHIREEKYHIPKETWKTWAVRVPEAVYDNLVAAQEKMARVLQLDLEDENARTKNLITIWECIASLVNTTDEAWLKIETEGGGPLEELAIRSKETTNSSSFAAKSGSTETHAAS